MRNFARVAVLVGTLMALTATASPAFAAITQPTTSPFSVLADGTGAPRPFTVRASGFQPDDSVFVEQCDGTPVSDFGWDPTINCDLGSSPAPAIADADGNVTFSVSNLNHQFRPFKGDSPQGLFNCRASGEAATSSLPSYTNCKVRLSTNNSIGTGDQQFFPISLTAPKLSCAFKGSMSFNKPITNVAPKKPKTTKIKGSALLGTDAGTACNNTNAPASATKLPVTSGSVKFKGAMPAGTKCTAVSNPNMAGTLLTVKWKGLKKGKLSTAGKSTTVVSTVTVGEYPTTGWVVTARITGGAFAGSTLQLQLALNTTVESATNTCNAGRLSGVSFTGTHPSLLAVF